MIHEKFVPEMFVQDQSTKYVYLENIVLYYYYVMFNCSPPPLEYILHGYNSRFCTR